MKQQNVNKIIQIAESFKLGNCKIEDLENLLYYIIATDGNGIENVLKILSIQSERKNQLITESNFELSRLDLLFRNPELMKDIKNKDKKEWFLNHVRTHFLKWWGNFGAGHCYIEKEKLEKEKLDYEKTLDNKS